VKVGLLSIFLATTAITTTTTDGFSPSHRLFRGVVTTIQHGDVSSLPSSSSSSLRFTQQQWSSAAARRFTDGHHSPKKSAAGGWMMIKRYSTAKATTEASGPSTTTTTTATTTTTLLSASLLIGLDIVFRRILQMASISFPSSLAGCGALFATMLLVPTGKGKGGESSLFQALTPGAALLAKWLPVFFVPSLVTLPLASGFGSFAEVRMYRRLTDRQKITEIGK
jgi:hypothetical protein